jgi:hypothetical protein
VTPAPRLAERKIVAGDVGESPDRGGRLAVVWTVAGLNWRFMRTSWIARGCLAEVIAAGRRQSASWRRPALCGQIARRRGNKGRGFCGPTAGAGPATANKHNA